MKHMRKLLALMIAVVMCMAMTVTAFASNSKPDISDTNGSITYTKLAKASTSSSLTLKNVGATEHTFQLYQLIVGDVDDSGTLSNISWGSGLTNDAKTALGDVNDKAATITNAAEAKAFADDLVQHNYLTGAEEKTAAAGENAVWTGLNPGYYIVIDKAASQNIENGAYTAYVMQVIGTATRNAKLDVPSVEKKVGDAEDSVAKAKIDPTDSSIVWNDSADHDFGDTIPYKLTGTLPTNLSEYETYTYKFTDTMTNLTYVANSARVFVQNGTTETEVGTGFTITGSGANLTVESTDVLKLKDTEGADITVDKDSKIIVYYQATLDNTAAIGSTGNPNVVTLTYSNNPNKGGEGDKGTTPPDKNIVFVYEIDANKIEKDTDAGTKTQAEYEDIEDPAEQAKWVKAADNVYYRVKDLDGADFTLYKEVTADYVPKEGETVQTGAVIKAALTAANPSVLANKLGDTKSYIVAGKKTGTSAGHNFAFAGIDDGTYVLVETTIPDGYNAIESEEVKVDATHDPEADDPKLTELKVNNSKFIVDSETTVEDTVTTTTYSGHIATEVLNQKGSTLPSTGGIGTTIFYVVGAILVVGAGVVLVTRRRMSA